MLRQQQLHLTRLLLLLLLLLLQPPRQRLLPRLRLLHPSLLPAARA